MNRNQLTLLNTLGLLGMTAVLLIGFILQFVLNELALSVVLIATDWLCDGGVWLHVECGLWASISSLWRHSDWRFIWCGNIAKTSLFARNSRNSWLWQSYFGNALLHMGFCVVRCNYIGCVP